MRFHSFLLTAACLLHPALTARAAEPPLRELLRDGLYAEEVDRDPEAAAKQYEQLLTRYAEQRDFAAAALFRLAEVRRKQDRKEDAIQLYQRLLTEFPAAANETKLARENLAAIGGKPPEAKAELIDEEAKELAWLESLAKNAPDIILAPDTLEQAARNGWSKVVAYLLAADSRPYVGDALRIAAEKGYLEIVRQLTAGDTPVPANVATAGIQAAIKFNRYTILDFLLQRGFKPGEMSGKYDSFQSASALAYALLNHSPQCTEILLKHGADLDATSGQPDPNWALSEGTALQRVIAGGNFNAANWLLDKGAKPDILSRRVGITPLHEAVLQSSDGSLALMQRLLEAGADPNRRTADREILDGSRALLRNATPLSIAVRSDSNSTEKVRLLLKHGADPKFDRDLIKLLTQGRDSAESMECLKLLVDAGAKPNEEWLKSSMANVRGDIRDFLVEKFTIPGFANDSEIQLVIDDPFGIRSAKIAVRSGDAAPPDLGAWLLANHQNSDWAYSNDGSLKYQWLIHRKNNEGVLTKQELAFSGSAPFPPLQWGDVVQCRIFYPSGSGGCSSNKGLPGETVATLRRRIAFPITFEIDGTSREIIVRGDRVIFDPTKNEVPLKSLKQVVGLLWQPGLNAEPAPSIHLTRKGWPDVRFSSDSEEAERFQLEAGDRVSLEISDSVRADLAAKRREAVTLKVDDYPFARSFGTKADGKPVEASIPTLIQALVDTQVPMNSGWLELGKNKALDLTALQREDDPFSQFSLLPHPDLANIRIRRLLDDGAEKVIDVNLAKIIATSTDKTSPEEARKEDVMLQWGDVVEVFLLKEHLGEPWKGFTAQEQAFFAKALSGRVLITNKDGSMRVRDLIFNAPRFQQTDFGWVPLPPETGIPSLRGSWLTGNWFLNLKRGDRAVDFGDSSRLFLRDADEVWITERRASPRVVPPPRPPSPGR